MGGAQNAECLSWPCLEWSKPLSRERRAFRRGCSIDPNDGVPPTMNPIVKNALAIVLGLVVGMAANMGLLMLNTKVLHPLPDGVTMQDTELFVAYLEALPATGFLVVILAHVAQALLGGWIAARFAASRSLTLALVIGALTALGSVINIAQLPGPIWMWVDPVLCLAAAWFVGTMEQNRRLAG